MRRRTFSRGSSKPREIPDRWRELFKLIPGYDPIATAPEGWWFDWELADQVVAFFSSRLSHIEGELAGQPLALQPWQAAHVGCAFGWKRPDGTRRYREVFDYEPRKNGKTTKIGGLINYVSFCDGEPGAQNYSAAAEREQAGLVYRQAKGMILNRPQLEKLVKIYATFKSIEYPGGVTYKALSADADTKHGFNTHFVVVDELHAQPNRELVDVLVTSTGARRQPLIWYITTADFMRPSICNEKYDYACGVRDGRIDDPGFLPVVYEVTAKDDWTDPAVWAKANPNLGVSVSREYIEREYAKAKDNPEYENTFKRLHLNLRTDADVRWLSSQLWDANAEPFDPAMLDGRDCYAGLDLANTLDVAALAKIFPPQTEGEDWYVLMDLWVPESAAKERQKTNRARYDAWISKGHMHRTDGDVIDYTAIRSKVVADAERYRIVKLMFDPWNATQFVQELQDQDGVVVEKFPQTLANFNEPCRRLVELLKEKRFRHGGQPVLRWMAGNVSAHTDGRGYIMPSRKKSVDKVDGIVALLMGLAPALGATTTKATVEVW